MSDLWSLEISPFKTENLEPAKFEAISVSISEVIERWSGDFFVFITPYFDTTTLSISDEPTGTSSLGILGISSIKLFIETRRSCKLSSFNLRSELIESISFLRSSVSSPEDFNLPNCEESSFLFDCKSSTEIWRSFLALSRERNSSMFNL